MIPDLTQKEIDKKSDGGFTRGYALDLGSALQPQDREAKEGKRIERGFALDLGDAKLPQDRAGEAVVETGEVKAIAGEAESKPQETSHGNRNLAPESDGSNEHRDNHAGSDGRGNQGTSS